MPPTHSVRQLDQAGILTPAEVEEFSRIRMIRNEVVHGIVEHHSVLNSELIERLESLVTKIPSEG